MKTILLLILFIPSLSFAWGKRGHFIVGQTASLLLAKHTKDSSFKDLSFDLGYYNNVPDIIWKSTPATYKKEFKEHFMDLEIFYRVAKTKSPLWTVDRKDFLKKYDPPKKAGRALWRVLELQKELEDLQKKLMKIDKKKKSLVKAKHRLQKNWMTVAGILGHYVADMAQPLHTTENYDGQLTNQKHIHSYFETTLVNNLSPQLDADVAYTALKKWDKFHKKNKDKSVLILMLQEIEESHKALATVLKQDNPKKRGNISSRAKINKRIINERLVRGSLYLAEIWSRTMTWDFNNKRFFQFNAQPKYIDPTEK